MHRCVSLSISALSAVFALAACNPIIIADGSGGSASAGSTRPSSVTATTGGGGAHGSMTTSTGVGVGGAPGAGGASSLVTTSTGAGGAGAAASCVPSASTTWPECSTSASSGGPSVCVWLICDEAHSVSWTATCMGNTCECEEQADGNFFSMCSCTLPGGADACITNTNCCFPAP